MEDYVGRWVLHIIKNIRGKIVAQDKYYITVDFGSAGERMDYGYPGCFSKSLKLLDESAVSKMSAGRKSEKTAINKRTPKKGQVSHAEPAVRKPRTRRLAHNGNVPSYDSVSEFYKVQKALLYAEIFFLKNSGAQWVRLFDGKRIGKSDDRFFYVFETDSELYLPNGMPISFRMPDERRAISANIESCDDGSVEISSAEDLGLEISRISFETNTSWLLEALYEHLEDIKNNPSDIVKTLVCDGPKKVLPKTPLNIGPDIACQMSVSQPILFVWGPPGTGKTETLAVIAKQHMKLGHRVLMLSYSNVAVDEALLRVNNMNTRIMPGKLLRYGYPRDKRILEHEYLTPYNYVKYKLPELIEERTELNDKKRRTLRTSSRFEKIEKRLLQIRTTLKEEERRAVEDASFIATTVSKAIVDRAIYESNFDTVIFDEASMAYIPQIVFSAGLAGKHFICLGDYSQLPPIVQSGSDSDLNCDIFRYCGIVDAVDKGCGHEWLCMLDTQYRMNPDIAAFASQTMYHSLLKSAPEMAEKRENIVGSNPFPGDAFHLVDISDMMAVRSKNTDRSRFNILSALISMGLAIHAAKEHEVGVITPYNAQSKLLRAMAMDLMESKARLKNIKCSTVHQFQGSERDVIIFDAVDSNIKGYIGKVGMPLASTVNDQANRLFNVAVTRAKGKLISVVNVDFMERKLPDDLIIRRMIADLQKQEKCTSGDDVIKEFSGRILKTFSHNNGVKAFLNDIGNAEREIVIDMPGGSSESKSFLERLVEKLNEVKQRGVNVIIRTDKIQSLPRSMWPLAHEEEDITNPIVMIDRNTVWYGMPSAGISFFSRGSKILEDVCKPIIRFESPRLCRILYNFLKIYSE